MAAVNFPASPTNGQQFVAAGVTWTWDGAKWTALGNNLGIPDAPSDGQLYGRKNASWSLATGGGRNRRRACRWQRVLAQELRLVNLTHNDITDWTATLSPYALKANYLPLIGGTLTGGLVGTTAAFSGATSGASFTGGNVVLNGLASVSRAVWGQTSGSNRWVLALGGSLPAESGGNVGSNLVVSSFADDGTTLATPSPLVINRATGVTTLLGLSAPQAIGDNRIVNGDMRLDQRNSGAADHSDRQRDLHARSLVLWHDLAEHISDQADRQQRADDPVRVPEFPAMHLAVGLHAADRGHVLHWSAHSKPT